MRSPLVHVVPLLSAQGYVARDVLPTRLLPSALTRLRVHPPIGSHPGLAGLACEAVRRIVDRFGLDPGETAALIVGHGNPQDPASAQATSKLSQALAASHCVAETACLFLSEAPHVETWRAVTGKPNVIVVPNLFSDGAHARVDVPALLADEASDCVRLSGGVVKGRRLWLIPVLGEHPGLAGLVMDMVLANPHAPVSTPAWPRPRP